MYSKSIGVFLALSFGIGYALQIGLLMAGLIVHADPTFIHTIILAALMFVPGLAAIGARQLADDDIVEDGLENLWPIPFWPAVAIAIGVPFVVGLAYGITTLFGWTQIDWNMGVLMRAVRETGLVQDLSPEVAAIAPPLFVFAGTLFSTIIGATIYAAVFLGSEYGWRGYLLPRLLPLGKWTAYAIVGILTFAWFLPLILSFYLENRSTGVMLADLACFLLLAVVFSAFLGELWRLSGNLGLTAIAAGALIAQYQQGMWQYMFVLVRDLPSGPFGVVAILLWAAMIPVLWFAYPKFLGPKNQSR